MLTMSSENMTINELNDEKINNLLAPIVYLCIMLIIGVPGNLAVLIIYGRRYTKSVHRTIVFNLAIADQIFCTVGIPFNIARIVHFYSFEGEWVCIIFVVMLYFLLLYSTHLLMLLSFHRFRKICFPLKGQTSQENVKYWIFACFLIAAILSSPFFGLSKYETTKIGQNLTGYSCAISLSNPSVYSTAFSYGFLALFFIYTTMLVIIYAIIGRKIYQQRKKGIKAQITKTARNAISSKMTKIAFSISVVFALSYIPLFILQITGKFIDDSKLSSFSFSLLRIGERLYVLNHVANPFVYGIFDQQFKKHLKELIACKYRITETSAGDSTASTGV